jgi:hypothetical protein
MDGPLLTSLIVGITSEDGCHGRAIAYGFLSRRFSLVMTDFGGSDQVWAGLKVRPGPKFTPTDPYAIALPRRTGLSHLRFAELGKEACEERFTQGSAIELAFH